MPSSAHGGSTVGRRLTEALGGSWLLIYEGDNLVFRSDDRIAKLARHPDGRQRLQTGLTAAATCATAAIPVVQPLRPELVETSAGPVSLWPYIDHRGLEAPDLDYEDGYQLGLALAALAQLPTDGAPPWDPFSRIPHRLGATEAPPDIVATVARTVELVQGSVCLEWGSSQFAHGDISAANALFTTAGVFLIDLDSAGQRPLGWDLACLDVHLVREHRNAEAFTGALDAWTTTLPPVDLRTMAILKATMAATFLLTLPPTSVRLASITQRCATIERWVSGTSRIPAGRSGVSTPPGATL
jgi:Ser/Thr protein kinase RdoA (MazF antagonist)